MRAYCTPGDRGRAPACTVFGEVVRGAEAVPGPGGEAGVRTWESAVHSQGD